VIQDIYDAPSQAPYFKTLVYTDSVVSGSTSKK
jgi:hypothetical protein